VAEWYDVRRDEWISFDVPTLIVDRVEDLPVDVLLGPTGAVILTVDPNRPVGFARVIGEP
jgi:hypothetical protein